MSHKRKYGDRRDWPRILSSDYAQMQISDDHFDGHITLYRMHDVREPLYVPNCGHKLCIVDSGHSWLHQIPRNGRFAVTAMFDMDGNIGQWYIDICSDTGVGDDDVPWFDDLYLDIVVLPSGQFELIDVDELQEAFDSSAIDLDMYNSAWAEANRLQWLLVQGRFDLLQMASQHRQQLLQML